MTGSSGSSQPAISSKPKYELTFDTLLVDFGRVKRGDKRQHTYRFQNTGTESIVIDIVTSCDCTSVTWPEAKVIRPGDRNEIHAVFDSTEKEKSETVDIDIILQQTDARGAPIVYTVQYKFELE